MRTHRLPILLLCLLLAILTACSVFELPPAYTLAPTLTPESTSTETPTPGPTDTPTPSVPSDTPTLAVTLPPWGVYASPETTPVSTLVPTPAGRISQPDGQVSILLLGSDRRPSGLGGHTDVMILLIIRGDGSISLVSFPRDLYVYIPGWQMQRLNTAYPHGGFDLIATTFEYNFGVRPQHYIVTNFSGFKDIVDSLGGIQVNAASYLSDQRDGFPEPYAVGPGTVFMDGETALWYVRARGTSNDLDRLRRAQEVLLAIGNRLFTSDGLSRVPELYNLLQNTVETDLSLDALTALVPLLQAVNTGRVDRYTIGFDQVIPWTAPATGAELLLPNADAIRSVMQQAIGRP